MKIQLLPCVPITYDYALVMKVKGYKYFPNYY